MTINNQPQFKFLPTEQTKPELSINGKVFVLYGEYGTGKTTAINKLNPLVQDTQKGMKAQTGYVVTITSWQNALDVQKELLSTKNQFDVVSIDMTSDLIKFLEEDICKKNNVSHISDLAYGKGFSMVKEAISKYVMDYVKSDKTVFFVAHAKEKQHSTKTLNISIMQSNLSAAAQEIIFGLADFVFYAYVSSEGRRLMRTQPHRNIICKNRFNIGQEVMPLDFIEFKKSFNQQTTKQEK